MIRYEQLPQQFVESQLDAMVRDWSGGRELDRDERRAAKKALRQDATVRDWLVRLATVMGWRPDGVV